MTEIETDSPEILSSIVSQLRKQQTLEGMIKLSVLILTDERIEKQGTTGIDPDHIRIIALTEVIKSPQRTGGLASTDPQVTGTLLFTEASL